MGIKHSTYNLSLISLKVYEKTMVKSETRVEKYLNFNRSFNTNDICITNDWVVIFGAVNFKWEGM